MRHLGTFLLLCAALCMAGCSDPPRDFTEMGVEPEPAVRPTGCVPACGPGLACDTLAGVCRLIGDAAAQPEPGPGPEPGPAPVPDPTPGAVELLGYFSEADLRDGQMPTHDAHLIGRDVGGSPIALLYNLGVRNPGNRARDVVITVQVDGFSDPFQADLRVEANADASADILAPLDAARVAALSAPARSAIWVSIAEGGQVVHEDRRDITVMPRAWLWWVIDDAGMPYDVRQRCVSHVTPDDREVQTLLTEVGRQTAAGRVTGYANGADGARDQLGAVFSALKVRGLRFARLGAGFFFEPQPVQLPSETLGSGSGDVLEGALLVAAALEAMDLEPIVSFGESHVLVGVRQTPGSDRAWMIELGDIQTATVDAAMEAGVNLQNQWVTDADPAFLPVDVAFLRSIGVIPMPTP